VESVTAPAPPDAGARGAGAGRIVWLGLAIVLAVASQLRLQATAQSEVVSPIVDDAAEYFWYAYNLKEFQVYSRRAPGDRPVAPAPDALRPPGYPLFLAALTDHPPTHKALVRIVTAQALIGVLVTLLTFLLARRVVPSGWALVAAVWVAASPHLVNAGIYVLSETLFSLSLIALLLILARRDLETRLAWVLAAGALVGCSALIRPTSNYLPLALVALFFLRWPARRAWRASAVLLLGFGLVFAPWAARNALLPDGSDDRLKINMLHHGMYPDFTYEGAPESYGIPYRADPRSNEIGASLASVTAEIARRFREEPGRHLRWYLLGKPVALWSWNEVQGMGGPFIYLVARSPYFESALFRFTEASMYALHWACVMLAAAFCIAVWLPGVQRRLPPGATMPAQACAVLLLYITALHMVGFPLPRYAVPFRPELYLAACATLHLMGTVLRGRVAAGSLPS